MASVTRLDPRQESELTTRIRLLIARLSRVCQGERGLVLALVTLGLVAHSFNMLHYPSFTFKDDEGIYAAQSWAVLRMGSLTPYTYFYDHAPVGWLMAAGWMMFTDGLDTFGGAVDSGRVLMLVLHLAMIPLLYGLVRRLEGSPVVAALATALFSLSPLAIFYQRMFLLDNIMLFWLLLSLYLVLDKAGRLSHLVLSGLTYGLALVTKETAIFMLPVILWLVWRQRRPHHSGFGAGGWLVPMLMVVSWYPLYALFKGELLGAGQAFGFFVSGSGTGQGVSLVDALKWQSTRGGGGFLNLDNLFWQLVRSQWGPRDPILLFGGSVASLINLGRGWRNRPALIAGLLGILPLFYLARGGIVFDYYILFAIPFLCLNLALGLGLVLKGRRAAWVGLGLVSGLLVSYALIGSLGPLYTETPDQAGREALVWIKQNLPAESNIITRDDLWTGLHEPNAEDPAFPNAHSHWKVASDPAIRDGVFHGDWRTVDYLIMSPGLKESFEDTNNKVALDALAHAELVKHWEAPSGTELLHPRQIIEVWKVNKK